MSKVNGDGKREKSVMNWPTSAPGILLPEMTLEPLLPLCTSDLMWSVEMRFFIGKHADYVHSW